MGQYSYTTILLVYPQHLPYFIFQMITHFQVHSFIAYTDSRN